ncbi:MAG: hypothetical protein P8Y42_19460 [Exilibacterium sp.]
MKKILSIFCFIYASSSYSQYDNRLPIDFIEDIEGNKILLIDEQVNMLLPEINIETIGNSTIVDESDKVPRVEYVLSKVEQKKLSVALSGKELTPDTLGFYYFDEFYDDNNMPFAVKNLNNHAISADSDNIIFLSENRVRRIYEKTEFGSLLIDDIYNANVFFSTPVIKIKNFPASIVLIKHKDDKERARNNSRFSPPIHPAWRRCENFT